MKIERKRPVPRAPRGAVLAGAPRPRVVESQDASEAPKRRRATKKAAVKKVDSDE